MLIGNKYADNKLYRGIKHYDGRALPSSDLHEYADTLQRKNAFLTNNILGSGILNEPSLTSNSSGISLTTPAVVLIDGDIALIQSDSELLKIKDIQDSGISDGVLCIVGWYQYLDHNSTLRSYGGVNNSVLENDMIDPNLKAELSTRYQLRWDTVIIDRILFESNSDIISFDIKNRDASGNLTSGNTRIATYSRLGDVRIAQKPTSMSYAYSELYIVPILEYEYVSSRIQRVDTVKPLKAGGSVSLVKSSAQPVEDLEEGLIWYDTENVKFYIYITGVGFVPTSPRVRLLKFQRTVNMNKVVNPSDINVNIEIDYQEGDILQVLYEDILLTEDIHYTVDVNKKYITLKEFTTEAEEKVTFILIKVDKEEISSAGTLILF